MEKPTAWTATVTASKSVEGVNDLFMTENIMPIRIPGAIPVIKNI